MSVLTIELPADLDARLETVAARRRVEKAQVAREMIESCLPAEPIAKDSNEPRGSVLDLVRDLVGKFEFDSSAAPGPRIVPRPGSALELAGDLVGCIEGPGDLSTNPKYMEGFGR